MVFELAAHNSTAVLMCRLDAIRRSFDQKAHVVTVT